MLTETDWSMYFLPSTVVTLPRTIASVTSSATAYSLDGEAFFVPYSLVAQMAPCWPVFSRYCPARFSFEALQMILFATARPQ